VSFDGDTALEPAGDGAWTGAIAEGWETPRGPLGGYVMALVVRGFELAVGQDERQARSVTMHFLRAPKPGAVTVRVRVERAGRSLTSLSGRLEQDGELVGMALAAYARAWPGPLLTDAPMPAVDPPPARAEIDARATVEGAPPFFERLVMEPRFGEPAFSGADHAEVGGWLGLREERPLDSLAMAVLADAWFPAPWPRLSELAPAPTIDLTVHFRAPLPLPDSMLLGRFESRVIRDGFFDENGELWAPDGMLVAQSRQLGLLLGAKTS
jgi:acyl-CoA thioesterase